MKNRSILDINCSLFNINLVFYFFEEVQKKLLVNEIYKPKKIEPYNFDDKETIFTFEYIKESKDLIFPLCFTEHIVYPTNNEINDFNKFILDKFSENNSKLTKLIEQLIIDIKIPCEILVKYWLRAYTFETDFYHEMNKYLKKNFGKCEDLYIFIRVLYYSLSIKAINPLLDIELYRGSKIKKDELNYIDNSLKNKKEDLPGCICFNKAFLSSSSDKNIAIGFMLESQIDLDKDNEVLVLFIFKKGNKIDEKYASNSNIENIANLTFEKETLFFSFFLF